MFSFSSEMFFYIGVGFCVVWVANNCISLFFKKFFGINPLYKGLRVSHLFLGVSIVPPIEELIFRSPVYFWGTESLSLISWMVILLSAVLFGLIHISNDMIAHGRKTIAGKVRLFINTTTTGIVSGWVVIQTQSLLSVIMLHY